jgi:hypothetical protein
VYECGGSALHVYPSPSRAGESTARLATWYVDDVERVVDELVSNGVTFERYEGVTSDAKGISPRAEADPGGPRIISRSGWLTADEAMPRPPSCGSGRN